MGAIEKFCFLAHKFSQFELVLKKLSNQNVYFLIGGSASLYLQGNTREPHDIDLMFNQDSHVQANDLFNLKMEYIERPNVTMYKSTPALDGSIDFLSQYTVMDKGRKFQSNPVDSISLAIEDNTYLLVPVEKIIIFKLIGRRLHHQDILDVKSVLKSCDINRELFWEFVDQQKAKNLILDILHEYKLTEFV